MITALAIPWGLITDKDMKSTGASALLLISSILAAVSCASDAAKKSAVTANSAVIQTSNEATTGGTAPETAIPSTEESPDSQDSRNEDAPPDSHQKDGSNAEDTEILQDNEYTQNQNASEGQGNSPNSLDGQAGEQMPGDKETPGDSEGQDAPKNPSETDDQGMPPETALALKQNPPGSQGDADSSNSLDGQAGEQMPGDKETPGDSEGQDAPKNPSETDDQGMPPETALALKQKPPGSQGDAEVSNDSQEQEENHIEPEDRGDLDSSSMVKDQRDRQEEQAESSALPDSLMPEENSKIESRGDRGGEKGVIVSQQSPQTSDAAGPSPGKQPPLNESDNNDGLNVAKIPEGAIYESENVPPKKGLELDSEEENPGGFSADLQGKGWVFRSDLSTSGDWRFVNREQVGDATRFNFQFGDSGSWNLVFDRRSLTSEGVERVVKKVSKGIVNDVSSEPLQDDTGDPILGNDKKLRQLEAEAEQQTESGEMAREAMIREAIQSGAISLLLKWLPLYLTDKPDLGVLISILDALDNTGEYDEEEMAVLEKLLQFQTDERSAEWLYRLAAKLEKPGERRDISRAMELYQMVVDSWPYSEWRNLAGRRLIWLSRHFFRLQ